MSVPHRWKVASRIRLKEFFVLETRFSVRRVGVYGLIEVIELTGLEARYVVFGKAVVVASFVRDEHRKVRRAKLG